MLGKATPPVSSHVIPLHPHLTHCEPPLQDGIRELLRANDLAIDAEHDRWDFAVELKVLRRLGLTESDFRWLVCKRIVEHAVEITPKEDSKRSFRVSKSLKFKKRSCFVLSQKFLDELSGARVGGIALRPHEGNGWSGQVLPRWDGRRHELWVDRFVVKRFRWPAKNQETVLAALGEEQWPAEGVDDPLPPHPDKDPKQRLRDTIKCLNRHHEHPLIRFRGNGTGERIMWEFTALAVETLDVDLPGTPRYRGERLPLNT